MIRHYAEVPTSGGEIGLAAAGPRPLITTSPGVRGSHVRTLWANWRTGALRGSARRSAAGDLADQVGRRAAAVDQGLDVLLRAAQRVEGGHALERLAVRQVEDDAVPGRRGDRVRVLVQAA